MMESADLGKGDDAAVRRWLDRARLGRILLEGEVSARQSFQQMPEKNGIVPVAPLDRASAF